MALRSPTGMEERFGNYRLLVELGRGGMAEVYLALPEASPDDDSAIPRKPIVIKRLHPHLAEDPEFVTMFMDEARLAGRLQHPNVVEAHEVGQVGENYFIAMEFLDGQALRRIQTRADKVGLALRELGYAIIVDVLSGLHHAHNLIDDDGTKLSVVHRDVTPHNVFVTYDGKVKVVDFGIAKAERRAQETRQGIVKGKVRYMAPEQSTGQTLDRRVDLFATGVLLWELAAGQRLWKDVPDLKVVERLVRNEIPRHPREVNPSVPQAIDEICARALAYEPGDRFASALEMRRALEAAVGDAGLRKARSELGPTITKLFEEDRAKLKGIVEKQLARVPQSQIPTKPPEPDLGATVDPTLTTSSEAELTDRTDTQATLVRDAGERTDTQSASTRATTVMPRKDPLPVEAKGDDAGGPRNAAGPSSTSTPVVTAASAVGTITHGVLTTSGSFSPAPSPRPRRLVVAGIVAGVATVAAIGLFTAVRESRRSSPNATAPDVAPARVAKLTLSATPANAVFTIDDGQRLTNPYDGEVPRDDRPHTIRIDAPGHAPETRTVRFDADVVLSVNLVALTPRAPATSAPSAAPTAQRPPTSPWNIRPWVKPAATKSAAPSTSNTSSGRPRVDTGDPWK